MDVQPPGVRAVTLTCVLDMFAEVVGSKLVVAGQAVGSGVAVVLNVDKPSISPEIANALRMLKNVCEAVCSVAMRVGLLLTLGTAGHPMLPEVSNTSSRLTGVLLPVLKVTVHCELPDPVQGDCVTTGLPPWAPETDSITVVPAGNKKLFAARPLYRICSVFKHGWFPPGPQVLVPR